MASSSSLPNFINLDLTNEEANAIYTPDFDFFEEDPRAILIGKFISTKPIDDWAILQAFEGIWKKNHLKSISTIRESFFRIEFASVVERDDVYERGPWLFKDEWMALAEYVPGKSMDDYSFNPMRIWFRILALPKPFLEDPERTHLVGQSLGAMVGTVLRTDTRKERGNMTEFLRVEILMDISKPIRRFLLIGKGTRTTSCRLQYERLPLLCHGCGLISHIFEHCPNKALIDPAKLQYGDWLRWLPPRRRDQGPRGRIRSVEPSDSANRQPPSDPTDKGKAVETPIPTNQQQPLGPLDKGKSIVEHVPSAQDSGNLNEGDAASFADLPNAENDNNEEMVGEESSEQPPPKVDPKQSPKEPIPSRVISPKPLNTIYPVQVDPDDDTAQQVRNLDAQLTSAPAPIPIPPNRGVKRRSPIQVVLQPKKSRPSPSPTLKAGMSSGKNSLAAADAQPRRGK